MTLCDLCGCKEATVRCGPFDCCKSCQEMAPAVEQEILEQEKLFDRWDRGTASLVPRRE